MIFLDKKLYLKDVDEKFISKCKWSKDYNVFDMFNLKGHVIYNYKIIDVYIVKRSLMCDCYCLCKKSSVEYGVRLLHIVRGAKKSCGCYRGLHRAVYSDKTYIGKVYGDLTVVDILSEKERELYVKQNNKYHNKIIWRCYCSICDTEVILPAFKVVSGYLTNCGCSMKYRNSKYKNKDLIGTKINNIEILDIIDKKGEKTYWVLRCPFCESVYISDASHTVTGHRKSCGCLGKSFGEKSISKILRELRIEYKQEETFPDLLGNDLNKHTYLRYDFLIYKKGILVGSIEFDGLHHFYIEYQRGCYTIEDAEKRLKTIQKYDKLKDDYMVSKGIKPLHIKYTRKFEDIEYQVKEYLNKIYFTGGV